MDGIRFNRKSASSAPPQENEAITTLLSKQGDLEMMLQKIGGESVVWLTPAKDASAIEFFFIHEGGVELALDDGLVSLEAGEAFTVCGLTRDIPVKLSGDTQILYVTHCPSFAAVQKFEENLTALLMRVNEKDNYTYRHSKAVLRYSLALYDALSEKAPVIARDDLAGVDTLIGPLTEDVDLARKEVFESLQGALGSDHLPEREGAVDQDDADDGPAKGGHPLPRVLPVRPECQGGGDPKKDRKKVGELL